MSTVAAAGGDRGAGDLERHLGAERRRPVRQTERRIVVERVAPGFAGAVPVRLADTGGRRDRGVQLAATDHPLLQHRNRRRGRSRATTPSPAAAPAAAATAAGRRRRQRARRGAVEAAEFDLLHVQVGRPVVRHEHGHLDRLSGNDDAIVGQHLDADAVGQQDGLLEFALFLPQPEVDVISRRIVERHRAKLTAQDADGVQARRERRHDRFASLTLESLLRQLDRRR